MKDVRSLKKRFKLNVLSYGYSQIVTLAVQLLLVPFFLKFWGTDRYADWLVLSGVPMMLVLLDLGVAQALASSATMQAGAGKRDEATASLQTAFVFTIFLCLFLLILAFTFGWHLNWSQILGLSTLSENEARIIVVCMTGFLCAGLMGGPLDAWFRTIDRTAAGAFLLANRRMLDVVVSIAILYGGGDAVDLAVALVISQCLIGIALYVVAIRWSPWSIFGVSKASRLIFYKTLKPALAYMGIPVAQVITLQGGLQVLNQVGTPTMIVAFTMARTLMRLIMQAGVVANNALKPEISRLNGQGRISEAIAFSKKLSTRTFVFSILVYAFLVYGGPWIIAVWSHQKVATDHMTMALVGLHTLAAVAWWIPGAILIATNRHASLAVPYAVTSVLALMVWVGISDVISPILGASLLLLMPELMAIAAMTVALRRAT